MFDDTQTDQSQNNNQQNDAPAAPVGLGVNPTSAPIASAPQVVLPNPDSGMTHPTTTTLPNDVDEVPTPPPSGDLEDIKRQALLQLSPLVGKLDQTPEEKYKTLMMMIQASDNKDLISAAYDNAQKIEDEKTRAEALLNIVNEINYFNQKDQAATV